MEYITYTGSFDSEGKALVEQPSEEIRKKLLEGTDDTDLILYAYDATGENAFGREPVRRLPWRIIDLAGS